ncbi:p-hydroxyphenylacetate 3-hydroxylase reductase component [Marinomonas piezotolerans]|nr:flavin reductase [Marinomonas piezotolerans]
MMSFDPKEFRRCLGNFATGVTVITAQAEDGTKVGVTANSFNSVSLDPPLVLWSIIKESSSYSIFEKASHFAVNILAADQINLSNNFARPSEDKFSNVDIKLGMGNAPILQNTAANLQCENYQIVDGGDHWIMIGKVVAFENLGRSPLLYVQGSYAGAIPFTVTRPSDSPAVSEQTFKRLHNSAIYLMTQVQQKILESYLPKQSSTGLSTSEARLLLILSDGHNVSYEDLLKLSSIPETDVQAGLERLESLQLVESNLLLTELGHEMAERLWNIAQQQTNEVFEAFSDEEYDSFKHQLQTLLKQLSK